LKKCFEVIDKVKVAENLNYIFRRGRSDVTVTTIVNSNGRDDDENIDP